MMRKSLEEQLAEAQARQERIKARLNQLEARKRIKDRRLQAYGEKTLVRILLERAASEPGFMSDIRVYAAKAKLRDDERAAILWVLSSVEGHSPEPMGARSIGPSASVDRPHLVGATTEGS